MTKPLASSLLAALLATSARAETLPRYTVEISLSDAAAAKLNRIGEAITVSATYFGDAMSGFEDDSGMQEYLLAREEVELKDAGTVRLGGIEVSDADVKKMKGKPLLSISVYTARRVHQDNLLSCEFWQGDPEKAAAAPIVLACKLIHGE